MLSPRIQESRLSRALKTQNNNKNGKMKRGKKTGRIYKTQKKKTLSNTTRDDYSVLDIYLYKKSDRKKKRLEKHCS